MIHVILADGFEEIEDITVIDILRRCKLDVQTVSISGKRLVTGTHNLPFMVDAVFRFSSIGDSDCIVLPGGMPGAENLATCHHLHRALLKQDAANKLIAAICAAPAVVLAQAGLMDGRKMTCYPGFEGMCGSADVDGGRSVVDGNFVTANGPSSVTNMCYEILKIEKGGDTALNVLGGMLVDTDKGDFSL